MSSDCGMILKDRSGPAVVLGSCEAFARELLFMDRQIE